MQARKLIVVIFFFITYVAAIGQKQGLVSGPWAGHVEMRNATIWMEVLPVVKIVAVKYYPEGKMAAAKTKFYKADVGKDFNPVKVELNGLEMNTTYHYSVLIDGKPVSSSYPLQFTTKDLWEWRK